MGTTKDDIRRWLASGRETGATHLVVMCDTFDHSDYPVFIPPGEDAREAVGKLRSHEMQRVMEVYNLAMPDDEQLAEHRAFNY